MLACSCPSSPAHTVQTSDVATQRCMSRGTGGPGCERGEERSLNALTRVLAPEPGATSPQQRSLRTTRPTTALLHWHMLCVRWCDPADGLTSDHWRGLCLHYFSPVWATGRRCFWRTAARPAGCASLVSPATRPNGCGDGCSRASHQFAAGTSMGRGGCRAVVQRR